MRIGVSHLKGAQRGRVETLEGPLVRIGSARDCQLRVSGPSVERVHAILELEGSDVHLRPVGRVLLNGSEVDEVVIQNYDLVEIGSAKLRLRLLPDGVALPARPGRRRPRRALAAAVLLLATAAAFLVVRRDAPESLSGRIENESEWAAARQRAHERRMHELRAKLENLEKRVVNRSDVDARMGAVQRAVAEVESNVFTRVTTAIQRSRDDNPARRVITEGSGAVCLVQGAYGFGRVRDGKWSFLREVDPDLLGELDLKGSKVPLMLDGKGALFQVEFTGTGFLVDDSGVVMTNRHIAQPWWKNEGARPLIEDGFEPRFMFLKLFFPGRREGVDCDLARVTVSEDADLAALRFRPFSGLPKPLELAGENATIGREVILLGYPSGLNALMARSEETFKDNDPIEILGRLAAQDLVRPLPTRGHISDVLADKVVFDAPTAIGGSGGPLIDLEGHVVAINYGLLKSFAGANFAVPARFARALLERGMDAAPERR